ncbi:uncharacterized protein M421DRAFT_423458 [Didymella exigua CBS 183.55]|uniref:Acyltransferase 3 domain-containing protein n=1 Tax=Didymella exigua CBS 183.55 TaxID=1150837 RepID=A0A6A5RE81_9PLEO|nr:uncharacterized protein M421DRAFT_423458 [Didymella exigua CBS 183.55]KAF1925620.1 hypothetical protein M421DRAFT_423458 [Didymella exigua CBS 183.55]
MLLRKIRLHIPAPTFPGILFAPSSENNEPTLSNTAWLDGVRGFAALIVAINHITSSEIGFRFQGFHAQPVDVNTSVLQLPPFRIIFGMKAMVPLFFVVSGYCLSIQFIRRLRNSPEDISSFFDALSGAVFRRGIRLFVPFLTMAVSSQILLYLGAYDWKWWSDDGLVALVEDSQGNPIRAPIRKHARFLYEYLGTVMSALNHGFGSRPIVGLNPALWTIPAEFRGSLLIYLCFVGLARVKHTIRLWILVSIAFVLLAEGMWELWTFIGGLLIAELHERSRCLLPWTNKGSASNTHESIDMSLRVRRRSRLAILLLWAFGLYLLCLPSQDVENQFGPVYGVATLFTLPHWRSRHAVEANYHGLGATLCVAALGAEPMLRRPFQSRLGQFFGRISFTLYLVHQLVARILMHRFRRFAILLLGEGWQMLATYSSKSALMVVMLWISEILVEVLDKGSVVLAKRLFEKWVVR